MSGDTRWLQRFGNYQKALRQLDDAVRLSQTRELSLLEKQGLAQAFEFTHELAWNMLKVQGAFETIANQYIVLFVDFETVFDTLWQKEQNL